VVPSRRSSNVYRLKYKKFQLKVPKQKKLNNFIFFNCEVVKYKKALELGSPVQDR